MFGMVLSGDYKGQGTAKKNGRLVITLPMFKVLELNESTIIKCQTIPGSRHKVQVYFRDGKQSVLLLSKSAYSMLKKQLYFFSEQSGIYGNNAMKKEVKYSKGIKLLAFSVVLDFMMLRMIKTGYYKLNYWGLFMAFIVLTIYSILRFNAIRIFHKNDLRTVTLNNVMNDSENMGVYYRTRDELISLLEKMSKWEKFVGKNNRLTEKPSIILEQIMENEEIHVSTALLRAYTNARIKIKNGDSFACDEYNTYLMQYKSRLSENNYNKAMEFYLSLVQFERVVGSIEEADSMEGHQFEHWCADLLRKNGFTEVEVTPGSGDQGVDILAKKDGLKYAVQCKCYSSDLGNKPVQEVNTGKAIYHCQVGAVMTNRYFTSGAKQAAEATGVLLWDRDKLIEMLK